MQDALTFQRTLFRRQQARIQRELGSPSDAFRSYQRRYHRRTQAHQRVLDREALLDEALEADVLYVGDYHTLPQAQALFRELYRRALRGRRRVVLGLECVPSTQQPLLDAWQRGAIDADAFFRQLATDTPDALALWPSFRALLIEAVALRLQLIAIDRASGGPRSLERRDAHAATRLSRVLLDERRPRLLVLAGQFHVAPCHLPEAVRREVGPSLPLQQRTLYQNCERPWFELQASAQDPLRLGVAFPDGSLCAFSAAPTLAQRSFLDYLEGGDAVLETFAPDAHLQLPRMVLHLGRMLGIRVSRAARAELAVTSPGAPSPLTVLAERAGFDARERRQLERHLLEGHSLYVPRASAICLTSLSLHHAAEEAAHRLRHLAVGAGRMEAARPWRQAFYARIWEEAFGFLGSRLLYPERPCHDVAAWRGTLREEIGETRAIAAHVLSHKALELADAPDLSALPPPREPGRFNAVTHALGYLLGDALSRHRRAGTLSQTTLRALFADPLEEPEAHYLAWARRLSISPPSPNAHEALSGGELASDGARASA